MNKIFKVIFSKALGRMVIVSEHAKGQGYGKTKSSKTIKKHAIASHKIKIVKLLTVVSSLFLTQHIFAGNILQSISCPSTRFNIKLIPQSGIPTTLNLAPDSTVIMGDNSVAINSSCNQRSFLLSNAIGIGGSASDYGVALGYEALAYQAYNVAIGSQAKANGQNSVAIGANSVADRDNSFAVGSSSNLRQITSVAAGAQSTDAVNLGQIQGLLAGANIQTSVPAVMYSSTSSQNILLNGAGGTTISNLKAGTQATDAVNKKQLDDSVKIVDDKVTALDGLKTLAIQYDSATQDTISLKGVNGTKITNLQDATLDANSKDAVTGRQLNTANQAINTLDGRVTTEVGTLDTRITSEVGTLDGKITTNSTAILGLDGRVTTNETDIANLQSGQSSLNQLAVQYDSASQDVVTLKGVNGTKLTNLQAGDIGSTSSTDAVTGGQLFNTNQNLANLDTRVTTEVTGLNTRIGNEVTNLDGKIQSNSTAISGLDGRVSTNETDIANLQSGQSSLNQLAVQYDSASQDVVTLKGVNGTKLTNLQAGDIGSTSSTDAVTGGQLFTTNQSVSNLDDRVTSEVGTLNTRIESEVTILDGRITSEVTNLDGKIFNNVQALTALDGRVGVNESDIAILQQGQGTLNQLAVQYDTANQDTVTLKGVIGTTLTNLKAGDISSASSTDAVTGGQLFTTNQNVSNLDDRVTSEVGTLNTRIESEVTILDDRITSEVTNLDGKIFNNVQALTALDGRVGVNESDIAILQQGQGTLNQLAVQYDTANQDTVTLKGVNGTTLTNLKAGDISVATSTDAVTGGQLFNTNQTLLGLTTQVESNANQFATALGGGASFNNGNLTLPSYSIQGKSFNNIGATFNAVNNELTALKGSFTDLTGYVNQQNQTVLDQAKNYTDLASQTLNNASQQYVDQNIAKVEQNAQQYTDQKVGDLHAQIKEEGKYFNSTGASSSGAAGGGAANIVGDHSLALGSGANVQGNSSVAIGHNAQVLGDSSISMGNSNIVTGHGSGAIGDPNIVNGNGSYVLGNDNTVNADHTFVIGNNVQTTAKNSIALGNNTELTRDDTVSVGATGAERQITHVANATEATDAVNLRQMQAANTETLKSANTYTDTRISNLESSFNDFSLSTEHRFNEIDERFDRQGAMSAAMMNMATSTSGLAGRNRIGVGVGFQGDEKAVAVGYQRMVNQNTSFSLGGAFTDDESSGGAGVGFSW